MNADEPPYCGWASSNPLKPYEKRLRSPRKREFGFQVLFGLKPAHQLHPGLTPPCSADFEPASSLIPGTNSLK